jgi:hypothetical protein
MSFERILCLANSYKHDHRCVAGISLVRKEWVRLAGNHIPGCLTAEESCYPDGTQARLLDVFEAELGEKRGSNYHPEDVLATGKPWRPVRRFDDAGDLRFLATFLNKGPALLKSYGDRVYDRAFADRSVDRSLELIKPDDLWWWIRDENGRRKNRALFRLGHVNRARYDLAVTDPVWLDRLRALPAGIYSHSSFFEEKLPKTFLTVSLSEPFERFHYKLVAGVITLPA